MNKIHNSLSLLKKTIDGEIFTDESTRLMYATDASAYREIPIAVVYPKSKQDIKELINFAKANKTSLIPRAAGTSLAGQVVGSGVIIDVSKHMTNVLEINRKENWVIVEPGVILDELNMQLEELGLFFGPETSTSNRCMIGGMVGNNACGSHSLIYGSTRDHIIEIETILSDGSEVLFKSLSKEEFINKTVGDSLENKLYKGINNILSDSKSKSEIDKEFPNSKLKRRNTGYALDLLLKMHPFNKSGVDFNFSSLLAGSEGTLAFTTAIKLNLVPLPPANKALICVHFDSIKNALKANLIALKHNPVAIELMDKTILDLTKINISQDKNRFFVKGDPGAILIVEFAEENPSVITEKARLMELDMKQSGYGYHFPMVEGQDINKVWELRKAGLGILNNMPGDAKPVAVIEDTAINPELLPDYIEDFNKILVRHKKECVYYAHIATGELHLRPILNLKDPADVKLFHTLAKETAVLVKKYGGSLSGEHGDGRLRGEFIPIMVGNHNYDLFKQIKRDWDPNNIFNPGKIVDTPNMNTFLRYIPGQKTREIDTVFDFSKDLGILRATEKCNGTGACRKTEVTGGTMCPSYMVSRNENQSTRARANILREFLTNSDKDNPFNHSEIYEVMDLCLSCKACKSECPSSVDITKLKAEFLQHYYSEHRIPLRTLLIANIAKINKLGSYFPSLYNFVNQNSFLSKITANFIGFTTKRKFPILSNITLDNWYKKESKKLIKASYPNGKVYLFNDEFTRFNDTDIGIKAILLLSKLGYEVIIPNHIESARTYLSKGLVKKAKQIANKNILLLKDIITKQMPLVGIEPSAILTFRDEYTELVDKKLIDDAKKLSGNSFLIDEFLEREMKKGKIKNEYFTNEKQNIKFHGHCHQKALAGTSSSLYVLNFPVNYTANEIPSGCCGMAGSFGFEKEHYEMSMKVGELVLFPAVRESDMNTIIAAPGTSCRHQIKDGTKRNALHTVEIMYNALVV